MVSGLIISTEGKVVTTFLVCAGVVTAAVQKKLRVQVSVLTGIVVILSLLASICYPLC
jgi:hypothetical protein